MTSGNRRSPRRTRLHRHCLHSLEIPTARPCILPRPPTCQVQGPCPRGPNLSCQSRRPACQVTPPGCQDPHLFCQPQPPTCQAVSPACQLRPPICKTLPPTCHVPPTCRIPTPCAMKHPMCQCDQNLFHSEICDDCGGSSLTVCDQNPSNDDNNVAYNDGFATSIQKDGGCENVEEIDNDHRDPRDAYDNNSKNYTGQDAEDSNSEDRINDRSSISPYTSSSSRTNQNASLIPNYRNEDGNATQSPNILNKDCSKSCQTECFLEDRLINREIISNPAKFVGSNIQDVSRNRNGQTSSRPQLENTGSRSTFKPRGENQVLNGENVSHTPRPESFPQEQHEIQGFAETLSNNSSAESSSICEPLPCCRPEYFLEQSLKPKSIQNEKYYQSIQEVADKYRDKINNSRGGNRDDEFVNASEINLNSNKLTPLHASSTGQKYDDDEMPMYKTKSYVPRDSKENQGATKELSAQGQNKECNIEEDTDINGEENLPYCRTDQLSPWPRSALRRPSNIYPKSGAKVQLRDTFENSSECGPCCEKTPTSNNVAKTSQNSPDHRTGRASQNQLLKSTYARPQSSSKRRGLSGLHESSEQMKEPKKTSMVTQDNNFDYGKGLDSQIQLKTTYARPHSRLEQSDQSSVYDNSVAMRGHKKSFNDNGSPAFDSPKQFRPPYAGTQSHSEQSNNKGAFKSSVPIRGPKKFSNCCDRGISKIIRQDTINENTKGAKNVACAQKADSSCGSTTCVENKTVTGCYCRYPPAFKHLSCAGNINGTCTCSDIN